MTNIINFPTKSAKPKVYLLGEEVDIMEPAIMDYVIEMIVDCPRSALELIIIAIYNQGVINDELIKL